MNKINEIKTLISSTDKVVVIEDENTTYINCEDLIKENKIVLDNLDLKVFYILSKDFKLDYELKNTSTLTEVFYEVKNNSSITQNYDIDPMSNCNIIEVLKNSFDRKTLTNVGSGAYLKVDNLYINDDSANVDVFIDIKEENANVEVNNVIISLSGKTSNYNLNTKHNTPQSTSQMITYAVSKNSSVLNVNTNGIIVKGASKTNLNQKTKGIILDSTSQISANPILEIDEYDVIASHGASIGAIDDEELYYLMSRGLKKEVSEKLIIGGLIYPFLNAISSQNIKEYVSSVIAQTL